MHYGHGSQRVVECRPAIAANFVTMSLEREDAAQFRVVTSKSKFQSIREGMSNTIPERNSFTHHHFHSPLFFLSTFSLQSGTGREWSHDPA